MISNNSIRMLNLDSAEDRELLLEEARRYFVYKLECISREYRIPDHVDIHLLVSEFITNSVREGRIHDDDLARLITPLTYALWIEALQIVEAQENDATDEEVRND